MYRFVISSKAATLNLLLEDRKNKKQWSTGDLEETDFLACVNRIPNATPADYVSVFCGALDCMMGVAVATDMDDDSDKSCSDDSSDEEDEEDEDDDDEDDNEDCNEEEDEGVSGEEKSEAGDYSSEGDCVELNSKLDPAKIRRKLLLLENDALQLELSVKVRVLDSAWTAKYLFRLEPISLERIDILEAKLRDVEEGLAVTRKMVVEAKKTRVVHLTATTGSAAELNDEGQMKWTSVEGAVSNKDDVYELVVSLSGCYIIAVKVHLQPSQHGANVELHVDGECGQHGHLQVNGDKKSSASLMLTTITNWRLLLWMPQAILKQV